jgi:benzoyl-CoA reductase/2-hydroxyglutaryl-CoA dehydratase subunit BcrC/BadD/HgdB
MFDVPATRAAPVARKIFLAELQRLGSFLEAWGGRTPSADQLLAIIGDYDRQRRSLRQAALDLPARAYAEVIAAFHWTGEARLPPGQVGAASQAVPLAVVGGPLPAAHWGLLESIERAGARVALNATESGERSLFPCWDAAVSRPDPLEGLVDAYWEKGVDVFQRPNTALYDWLRERVQARRIRGIVLWSFVGCDLWRAEAPSLRETLGLPVLLLDGNESPSGSARETGRLQAFVEMLP